MGLGEDEWETETIDDLDKTVIVIPSMGSTVGLS